MGVGSSKDVNRCMEREKRDEVLYASRERCVWNKIEIENRWLWVRGKSVHSSVYLWRGL